MGEQVENRPLVSGDTIAGGIMGITGTIINNLMAKNREDAARQENFELNEKSAENAYQRQLNYYDTRMSPAALLAQYRDAGLSPSLMFGGGGIGGGSANAPQGQGASGVSPNIFGLNLLESAQVGLMQAQTRKLNAEADTEEGNNTRGKAEIENITYDTATKLSQAGLNVASTRMQEVSIQLGQIDKEIKEATKPEQINQIKSTADKVRRDSTKALFEALKAEKDYDLFVDTYDTQVINIKNETLKTAKEIILLNSEVSLNKANERKIENEINKIWWDSQYKVEELLQKYADTELNYIKAEVEVEQFYDKLNFDIQKLALEIGAKYDEMNIEVWKTKRDAVKDIICTALNGAMIRGGLKDYKNTKTPKQKK